MTGVLEMIKIDKITFSLTNPRKKSDPGRMDELVESIKQQGVLQPVIVRPKPDEKTGKPMTDEYELVCGQRRVTASRAAGREEVPAIVADLSDKAVLEIQVVENMQREDVHPLEEAEGYGRLINEYGYNGVEEVAAKIGKSKSYVRQRIQLQSLTESSRQLFESGTISTAGALALAKVPQDKQDMAAQAISGANAYDGRNMTAAQIRQYIKTSVMIDLDEAPFDPAGKRLVRSAGSCLTCPKMSAFNIELFPDMADEKLCSDPDCYKQKVSADYSKKIAPYRKMDYRIIEEEEYGGTIGSPWDRCLFSQVCHDDPENRLYEDLLADMPLEKIMVGVSPEGKVVFAVEDDEAEAFLYRNYDWAKEEYSDPDQSENEDEDNSDDFESEARKTVVKTTAKLVGRAIRDQYDHQQSAVVAFLDYFFEMEWFEGIDEYCELHGIEIDPGADKQEYLKESCRRMNMEQAVAFMAEMLLLGMGCWRFDEGKKVAAAVGVDMDQMLADEVARLREEAKKDQEETGPEGSDEE